MITNEAGAPAAGEMPTNSETAAAPRDVAAEVMGELRALKQAQEEYVRKTNKELARLRRGEKASADDSEAYAKDADKSAPLADWQSMRELSRLESQLSPEQQQALSDESQGMSMSETLKLYRLAVRFAQKNEAPPPAPPAPGNGRGPAPQQPNGRMVQHPKSLYQYQRMSSEARKALDADDSFDPSILPAFVTGDGGRK